ncbi:hypothetical protein K431DRAFT_227397 [Polychaeton citri CBS 116435]|uniref:PTR2-domain-containing protein n=1 Tax=Polychaeton citri CBS 116435 TaxID=1314669 RepID=A0A9P4Q655_9PEZI|nr:hypothetical protein K431DRAFT_227397 [Polychaeton citri CBS 116435]
MQQASDDEIQLATDGFVDSTKPPPIADRLSLAVILVVLVGGAERFCCYAVSTPWQNYIQNSPSSGTRSLPGALGLGQSRATSINNAHMIFTFLTPMPMALLSDLHLGRFRTLLVSLLIYSAGALIQFASSLPTALEHSAGVGGLAASMILIGIGQGGVKATFSPFLGDQCLTEPRIVSRRSGRKATLDRSLTLQLIYNVFYWATNIASLSSVPATFLERLCGFWTAYLLVFLPLWVLIALLVFSRRISVVVPPQGNILPPAMKVMACAARNGFKLDHAKSDYQISHHGKAGSWSDSFVEDIRLTLRTSRVLLSFTIFYLCVNQMYTNLISQAGQVNLGGVPNDMTQAIAGIACVLLSPLIRAGYAFLARRHIVPGSMRMITFAFFLCAVAMAYSAGIQQLIYNTGPCYRFPRGCPAAGPEGRANNISVWVQTPVYFIFAAAEIFGFVKASEYSYTNSPKQAKSIVQALTQWAACGGSMLGLAISPVAKDPDLVVYYSSLAAVMVVSAGLFCGIFRQLDRDEKAGRINEQETFVETNEGEVRVDRMEEMGEEKAH